MHNNNSRWYIVRTVMSFVFCSGFPTGRCPSALWCYSWTDQTFFASLRSRSSPPAGRQPEKLLSSTGSGDAAHRLDSWPENQCDSYFLAAHRCLEPPSVIATAVPWHWEGMWREFRFLKVLYYMTWLNQPVWLRVCVESWIYIRWLLLQKWVIAVG